MKMLIATLGVLVSCALAHAQDYRKESKNILNDTAYFIKQLDPEANEIQALFEKHSELDRRSVVTESDKAATVAACWAAMESVSKRCQEKPFEHFLKAVSIARAWSADGNFIEDGYLHSSIVLEISITHGEPKKLVHEVQFDALYALLVYKGLAYYSQELAPEGVGYTSTFGRGAWMDPLARAKTEEMARRWRKTHDTLLCLNKTSVFSPTTLSTHIAVTVNTLDNQARSALMTIINEVDPRAEIRWLDETRQHVDISWSATPFTSTAPANLSHPSAYSALQGQTAIRLTPEGVRVLNDHRPDDEQKHVIRFSAGQNYIHVAIKLYKEHIDSTLQEWKLRLP